MMRVCGNTIPPGRVVEISTADLLTLEGTDIEAVWIVGVPDKPFEREGDTWRPPSSVRNLLETAGRLKLMVRTASGSHELAVDRAPVKLTEEELALMLRALRQLALSFEQPIIYGELSGSLRTDVRMASNEDERMSNLFEVIEQHLPPLLEMPIRILTYEAGAVPVHRVRPGPRTLIQQRLSPERTHVLGVAPRERPSEVDQRWLRAVVVATEQYAGYRERAFGDIRESGHVDPWPERRQKLTAFLSHPVLQSRPGRITRPTWMLSRSVHGAAILRAVEAAEVATALERTAQEWQPELTDMGRFPVGDHSHLYELWVVLSLVEILRTRHNFCFLSSEKQLIDDYATYDNIKYNWKFKNIKLKCQTFGLDGTTPVHLMIELRHGSLIKSVSGNKLTPDISLVIEGGEFGQERRTIHVLDAKYSNKDPLEHARRTARDKYLDSLEERPTSSFVALPSNEAATRKLMGRLDHKYRTEGIRTPEQTQLQTGAHWGLAWGSIEARPGADSLGLRQFLSLALQYHRSELRHICSQCGQRLSLSDVEPIGAGATRSIKATPKDRILAAHRDSTLNGVFSIDELIYTCSKCSHSWRRHACYYGHVLFKSGALTPHVRRDDAERNVVCSVCGHYRRGSLWKRRS